MEGEKVGQARDDPWWLWGLPKPSSVGFIHYVHIFVCTSNQLVFPFYRTHKTHFSLGDLLWEKKLGYIHISNWKLCQFFGAEVHPRGPLTHESNFCLLPGKRINDHTLQDVRRVKNKLYVKITCNCTINSCGGAVPVWTAEPRAFKTRISWQAVSNIQQYSG